MMKLLTKEHTKMKRALYLTLVLVSLLILGVSTGVVAGDKNTKGLSKTTVKGDAVVFDANNISTFIRNNGSFNRNPGSGNAGFEWPKGSGKTAIYASGLWLGAKIANVVHTACAEYSYEYGAGPIGANINDPQWKMYKIKRGDDATNNPDYANWITYGGPALRNYNNTADSLDGGGNKIPNLIGDMTVFCIYNDGDASLHTMSKTLPIGVEVHLTAWAYNRSDALGNTIYYKWQIINKSGQTLDQTYVCIWCDADVGNSGVDDWDGCDTTLGLGYTYNGQAGPDYPNGAAVGFDFLQGPIVPGAATDTAKLPDGSIYPGKKILKMTSYLKYSNDASDYGNPGTGAEIYNYFQGLSRSGLVTKGADSNATTFMFPGDPNLPNGPTNWVETDPPNDRRFMMTSGPFTMAANDTQEIVAGNVIASGASLFGSVTALKNSDAAVQTAYDLNFKLAAPPPSPNVEAVPLDKGIILTWGKDETTANSDESFHELDPIAQAASATYPYYDFQGYVVYQYNNPSGANPKIVATYDIKDGVKIIYDNVFDASIGQYVNMPVKYGSDAGVFRSIKITTDAYTGSPLVNNKDYYFGVSAYAYNNTKESVPLTLESSARIVTARARLVNMGDTYSSKGLDTLGTPNLDANNRSTAQHLSGISNGFVIPVVVEPDSLTGDVYNVTFANVGGALQYSVIDSTKNIAILSGRTDFADNDAHPIKDGVFWKVVDAPLSLKSVLVTSGTPWVTGDGTYGFGYFSGGVELGVNTAAVIYYGWAPTLSFGSYKKVEIRIDTNNQGWAYRYRRLANAAGPGGYRMVYQNMIKVPYQAWDITDATSPKRLNIAFRDQLNTGAYDFTNPYDLVAICASAYDSTGATYASVAGGPMESDAMYVLELAALAPHTVYESPNTITILPYYVLTPNDVYSVNTTNYKPTPGKLDVAKTQINRINAVPNPYFGANAYETNQFGHIMRITNLPAVAKIRIFNLAGQLLRTYDKNDPNSTSLDWDLNNASGLPVASGMYIIHIDMGSIGTKILKVAVIQAEERLNNF
jgi:hypothetical protein